MFTPHPPFLSTAPLVPWLDGRWPSLHYFPAGRVRWVYMLPKRRRRGGGTTIIVTIKMQIIPHRNSEQESRYVCRCDKYSLMLCEYCRSITSQGAIIIIIIIIFSKPLLRIRINLAIDICTILVTNHPVYYRTLVPCGVPSLHFTSPRLTLSGIVSYGTVLAN